MMTGIEPPTLRGRGVESDGGGERSGESDGGEGTVKKREEMVVIILL